MVFQSYALWPHMRVAANVGYPLKIRHWQPDKMKGRVDEMLELVGLGGFGPRYPRELSGGQQQRVALARALAFNPSILLLDEPLSNLDSKLRQNTLTWLVKLLRQVDITTIYVTHDQTEALAISDRIAVMNAGAIVQIGPPEEIYTRPRSRFVAEFIGSTNLLAGKVLDVSGDLAAVQLDIGGPVLSARLPYANSGIRANQVVKLIARPEMIRVSPGGGTRGVTAVVEARVYLGNAVEYTLLAGGTQIRVSSSVVDRFEVGEEATLTFIPNGLSVLSE
jgi:iron(III) transport system ATP-binding protein